MGSVGEAKSSVVLSSYKLLGYDDDFPVTGIIVHHRWEFIAAIHG